MDFKFQKLFGKMTFFIGRNSNFKEKKEFLLVYKLKTCKFYCRQKNISI